MARKNQDPRDIDGALEKFLRIAPTYGVEPTPIQIEQVRTYVTELLRWNEKMNLTGARKPEDVLLRHVLDSLIPLTYLAGMKTLLDVGPGGGFPGIPIKIFRPELFVVLLEARRKRSSFNQHIVDTLALAGIEVVWARLGDEEVNERYAGRPFDGIITRAALSDTQVVKMGTPVLQPGGRILLMVGTLDEGRQRDLKDEATRQGHGVVQIIPYRLPGLNRTRNLVLVR